MTSERSRELAFVGFLALVPVLLLLLVEVAIRLGVDDGLLRDTEGDHWDFWLEVGVAEPAITTFRMRPDTVYGHVSINSIGFRGPELQNPKPPGRVRVAVLGTSTVLGLALEQDQTLPALIVERLSDQNRTCTFDYVSVSGPRYQQTDLAWLLENVLADAAIDHVIILDPGPNFRERKQNAAIDLDQEANPALETQDRSHSDPDEVLELVKKFRIYWKYWVPRNRLEPDRSDRFRNAMSDQEIASIIEAERVALDKIVRFSQDADIHHFHFHGLARGDEHEADQRWKSETIETYSGDGFTVFPDVLKAVRPTRNYFYSRAHYNPKGADLAAALITNRILDAFPEPGSICE
ncbi:hypothetical protein [Sulfitobacter sp. SK012]|uniref:hypothetical protein n=1 Tax=Sulfitobacter sp. SK012 TaxID=1389005 RepID=UPI0013B3F7E6|nr:hypothetical protein [Sulfitobacter sp. SK012]